MIDVSSPYLSYYERYIPKLCERFSFLLLLFYFTTNFKLTNSSSLFFFILLSPFFFHIHHPYLYYMHNDYVQFIWLENTHHSIFSSFKFFRQFCFLWIKLPIFFSFLTCNCIKSQMAFMVILSNSITWSMEQRIVVSFFLFFSFFLLYNNMSVYLLLYTYIQVYM